MSDIDEKSDTLERLTLALFLVRMTIEEDEVRGGFSVAELDAAELLKGQIAPEKEDDFCGCGGRASRGYSTVPLPVPVEAIESNEEDMLPV